MPTCSSSNHLPLITSATGHHHHHHRIAPPSTGSNNAGVGGTGGLPSPSPVASPSVTLPCVSQSSSSVPHAAAAADLSAYLAAHYSAAGHPGNFLWYHPSHPLALLAAERLTSKSTSIADLRLKAQQHAAALGLSLYPRCSE